MVTGRLRIPVGPEAREAVSLSKTERREYLAGVLTAGALAVVLVFTALANRGAQPVSESVLTLTASFNRTDGIHIGSPVRVAGMTVGSVTAAHLDHARKAVLTFNFTQPVALPDDTAAVIETDGIFGSKYIELRPGGTDDMLKSGDAFIYTQDAVIIEDLVALIVQRAKAARAKPDALPPSQEQSQ
jgi:phospholipid/cholesterol/gamma-HCH transport system substrate-binding protein